MGIFSLNIIKYKITDLKEDFTLQESDNISLLRKNVNILIIDDNEFLPEVHLKKHGYQIVHKYDIDVITDVEPYEIILCDISGVGKKLGYEKEGAIIIQEIHKSYPMKRIIAYTANTYDAEYNRFFSIADSVVPKGLSLDDWINLLDDQVLSSINPIKQWKKIQEYLLEKGVSTLTVAKIEDKFVRSVQKKNFDILQRYIQGKNSNEGVIISEFLSSLCAKIILGSIGGGL